MPLTPEQEDALFSDHTKMFPGGERPAEEPLPGHGFYDPAREVFTPPPVTPDYVPQGAPLALPRQLPS
jgi:hypothetical protein